MQQKPEQYQYTHSRAKQKHTQNVRGRGKQNRILGRKLGQQSQESSSLLFTVTSTNGFTPLPPFEQTLKLVCNIPYIIQAPLENPQHQAQTPQRNCTFTNSASGNNRVRCLQVTIAKYRTLQTQKKDGYVFRYWLYPGLQIRYRSDQI